jgi:hypothetical protein
MLISTEQSVIFYPKKESVGANEVPRTQTAKVQANLDDTESQAKVCSFQWYNPPLISTP